MQQFIFAIFGNHAYWQAVRCAVQLQLQIRTANGSDLQTLAPFSQNCVPSHLQHHGNPLLPLSVNQPSCTLHLSEAPVVLFYHPLH